VHPRADAFGVRCIALHDRLIMHVRYDREPFPV
jgi:hypothetical protein